MRDHARGKIGEKIGDHCEAASTSAVRRSQKIYASLESPFPN